MSPKDRPARAPFWAGFAIGVAVDGLLDGAVLHQLLGWHHFLSGKTDDARVNMVADGAFHLVMLVILGLGLTLAWQGRTRLAAPRSGRGLLGAMFVGAGSFQVYDSVVDHWLLGLHHINPQQAVVSDLLFFAMGLAFIGAGAALRKFKAASGNADERGTVNQNAR